MAPKAEPGLEELMFAFGHPARVSLLKGDDADREANFRARIDAETSSPFGARDRGPVSLPSTVPVSAMRKETK